MKALTLNHSQFTLRRACAITLLCLPLWAGAAPLEAGAAWPTLTLKDQHDQPVLLDATTRKVIFVTEKSVTDQVTAVLGADGKSTLAQARAVLVADISAMPAMVSRLFAVPALRELGFSVALAREADTVADLPRRKGAATVLTLDNSRVTQVQYLSAEVLAVQLTSSIGLPQQVAPETRQPPAGLEK
jgi:hypothetical protein